MGKAGEEIYLASLASAETPWQRYQSKVLHFNTLSRSKYIFLNYKIFFLKTLFKVTLQENPVE